MCGSKALAVVERVMEISAGLRWSEGRERIRWRRARPRDQAVVEVKVGKRTEGEDSWAVRRGGFFFIPLACFGYEREGRNTSVLGESRGLRTSIV